MHLISFPNKLPRLTEICNILNILLYFYLNNIPNPIPFQPAVKFQINIPLSGGKNHVCEFAYNKFVASYNLQKAEKD